MNFKANVSHHPDHHYTTKGAQKKEKKNVIEGRVKVTFFVCGRCSKGAPMLSLLQPGLPTAAACSAEGLALADKTL